MCEAHGKKVRRHQRASSFIFTEFLVGYPASRGFYLPVSLRYEGQCLSPEVGGGGVTAM